MLEFRFASYTAMVSFLSVAYGQMGRLYVELMLPPEQHDVLKVERCLRQLKQQIPEYILYEQHGWRSWSDVKLVVRVFPLISMYNGIINCIIIVLVAIAVDSRN